MARGCAAAGLVIAFGCRAPSGEWGDAPVLDPAARAEVWSLAILGRPVGIEVRSVQDGAERRVVRRRTLSVKAGDAATTVRSASDVSCAADGACTFTLWDAQGTRKGAGRVDVPDVWPPAADGQVRVVDLESAELVTADAARGVDPSGARVVNLSLPSGPATVWLADDGAPVRLVNGRFSATRLPPGSAAELPAPVDVARLLAVPVAAFPAARRSHVGLFSVDGVEVRVDAPTWPELPPSRDAIAALTREVADRLASRPVFGFGTGRAALASGQGDCTEHALAFVALAEQRGFAARTVAGRVYADGPDGPALVLHAWAEVALGDRWIAVDPALAQFPADASHLPLGRTIAEVAARDPATLSLTALR